MRISDWSSDVCSSDLRGRTLRDCPGQVSHLKCPFHGFTWGMDGGLRGVPAREEFPTVKHEAFRLPEEKVALWGGFVFITSDLNAEPLDAYLGDLYRESEE